MSPLFRIEEITDGLTVAPAVKAPAARGALIEIAAKQPLYLWREDLERLRDVIDEALER